MENTISPTSDIQRKKPSQTLLKTSRHQTIALHPKTEYYVSENKNPSLVSVDHHPILSNSGDVENNDDHNDLLRRTLNSSTTLGRTTSIDEYHSAANNERQCALTQMLLIYAQQDTKTCEKLAQTRSDNSLNNILNVLELHFNTYADDKRHIYFEGIFQILHHFKEHITELALIETMQLLQIDPLAPCTFENFILILCHLPPIKHDHNDFLVVFNELDYNQDFYITFEDIQSVLPYLTSHFNEEIIRAAIHLIDTDHDHDRLSYFDFVTSLIVLQECELSMKTITNGSFRVTTEQRKE